MVTVTERLEFLAGPESLEDGFEGGVFNVGNWDKRVEESKDKRRDEVTPCRQITISCRKGKVRITLPCRMFC